MKSVLFFTIFCAFLPCFSMQESPEASKRQEIDYNAEMRLNTELGLKLKEALFAGKNNHFCKSNDPFCPSLCNHSSDVAYSYYENKPTPWSGVPKISFKSEQELTEWVFGRKKETYLLIYKSHCPACANMLAALETRADALKKEGVDLYKIYSPDHREIFSNGGMWDVEGTPTLWFFSKNARTESKNKNCYKTVTEIKKIQNKDFYKTIVHLRKENMIDLSKDRTDGRLLNFYNKMKPFLSPTNVWNNGYGYFEHDGKLATAAVLTALSYAAYKSYPKLKKFYQDRFGK